MRIIPSCLLQCFDRFDAFTGNETPSTGACSQEQRALLLPCYLALQRELPRSLVVPQILLYVLEGADFEARVASELRRAVRKGVPSFFNTLKPLCRAQPDKFAVVKRVAAEAMKEVEEAKESDPVAFVWASLFLAQMADFEHRTQEALAYLEKAIAHTPTCYDLYVYKAKVLRHAGALLSSAEAMRRASALDLADRYMNTGLTKSLLRCGGIEEADRTVSYWVRRDVPNRIELSLLLACWYEVPCADAYIRRGDVPHAYKLYSTVLSHFTTFVQDQFDFHGYVLRKSVLTTYYDFLHSMAQVYRDRYYRRAAIGALKCLIALHDHPFDEAAYKQTHALTPAPVHKKGAEFTDDKDADGLVLCAKQGSLDAGNEAVMELMLYAKEDEEAMKTVFEWASRKGDAKRCEEALQNLREACHRPLDAAYLEGKRVEKASADLTSFHDRVLLARQCLREDASADVLDVLTSQWSEVKCAPIEAYFEAYGLLKSERRAAFVALVKEHYPGFEEFVKAWSG